jgi:hypothetical protein
MFKSMPGLRQVPPSAASFKDSEMITSKNTSELPNQKRLREICKAISVAEAVLSPDWQYRYYSFNAFWSEGEEFCGMRNGHGDQMLILFTADGAVINGLSHEHLPISKSEILQDLPKIYHDFIFGEPVASTGTTFCIWTENGQWRVGDLSMIENDGSGDLLHIFEDDVAVYAAWAAQYYELDHLILSPVLDTLLNLYAGVPLSKDMVLTLDPNFSSWTDLSNDLREIDYPFGFE